MSNKKKNPNRQPVSYRDVKNARIEGAEFMFTVIVHIGLCCHSRTKEKPMMIDLCGQRFGQLEVACLSERKTSGGACIWVCECSCGNIIHARGDELRAGTKTCCPQCSRDKRFAPARERAAEKAKQAEAERARLREAARAERSRLKKAAEAESMVGRKFGKLEVKALTDKRKRHYRVWLCECECGSITTVSTERLNAGQDCCGECAKKRGRQARREELKAELEKNRQAALEKYSDCRCWRDTHCEGLSEMLCVTRGQCKFYKSKDTNRQDSP